MEGTGSSSQGGGSAGNVSLKIKSRYMQGLNGMLLKQGHVRANWKKRFFKLDFNTECLKYYEVPLLEQKSKDIDVEKALFKGGYKMERSTVVTSLPSVIDGRDTYEFVFSIKARRMDTNGVIISNGQPITLNMSIATAMDAYSSDIWAKFEDCCYSLQGIKGDSFRDWLKDSKNFLANPNNKESVIDEALMGALRPFFDKRVDNKQIKSTLIKYRILFLERELWIEALNDCKEGGYRFIDTPSLWPVRFRPHIPIMAKITNNPLTDVSFITPTLCVNRPEVVWVRRNLLGTELYSVVMIDADNIVGKPPTRCHYLHLLVCNISKQSIALGTVILDYVPPMPCYKSGPHRYFFVVFEQNRELSITEIDDLRRAMHTRTMNVYSIAEKLLAKGQPCALAGFFAQWDEQVDKFHETYNYQPLTEFLSPLQQKEKEKYDCDVLAFETAKIEVCSYYKLESIANIGEMLALPAHKPKTKSMKLTVKFIGGNQQANVDVALNDHNDDVDGKTFQSDLVSVRPATSFIKPYSADAKYSLIAIDLDMHQLTGNVSFIEIPGQVTQQVMKENSGEVIGQYVLWFIANIPGSDIEGGTTLLPYQWPLHSLRKDNSVSNRVVFLLYKQSNEISVEQLEKGRELLSQNYRSSLPWLEFLGPNLESQFPVAVRHFRAVVPGAIDLSKEPEQGSGGGSSASAVPVQEEDPNLNYPVFAAEDGTYGAVMEKKMSGDFFFKNRFIGLSVNHKRLYWQKSLTRMAYTQRNDNNKSISLAHITDIAIPEADTTHALIVITIADPARPSIKMELKLKSPNPKEDSEVFKQMIIKLKGA